jgi:Ni/Fe-hydrogenase subunit HybB-like protein
MMVPIFLTSATASGIALLLIVARIMQRFDVMKFKESMFRSLSTLLGTVIITDLFLLGVEILSIFWPTSAKPGHTIRMSQFITGDYALAFIPVLVLGIGAFALLAGRKTRHLPAVQITAAAMYVVAIFLKRYSLMAMGFAINPLGQYTAPYVPSLTEVLIAVGLASVGMLIVTISAKVLPLSVPAEESEEQPAALPAPDEATSSAPALEIG